MYKIPYPFSVLLRITHPLDPFKKTPTQLISHVHITYIQTLLKKKNAKGNLRKRWEKNTKKESIKIEKKSNAYTLTT